ncbi:MAG: CDP-glucose 4,6-dehydratase [Oligoflexales bacterium]|nr:CDP-glucose 4,6-dehydratase [Oligoflexales bacterium]
MVTGHTGFKGSWLTLLLHKLGAQITGYALEPPTNPSIYKQANLAEISNSVIGDIRNLEKLKNTMKDASPEIVIHMAAQPIVRRSYKDPIETITTNVIGTSHLLESIREVSSVRSVVNITTDKVYENREWVWAYRENEALGGTDIYSASKACAELVTKAYRSSFFNLNNYSDHKVAISTVRAGNVIGGGDWAEDRLIPDCIRAYLSQKTLEIRYPEAVRPWQHVLEPITGYLLLAERLYQRPLEFSSEWNFGPDVRDCRPVGWILEFMKELFGGALNYEISKQEHFHEAQLLKLDWSKARSELGWDPCWNLENTLKKIVEWTIDYKNGRPVREICLRQIDEFLQDSLQQRY